MKSIQSIVQHIVNDNKIEEAFIFSRIMQVWNENFPNVFKSNVLLLEFREKTLFLKIQSPVWRQEVQLISDKIISNLNNLLETPTIEKIIIKS